ncbi:MAG: hypothetical protein Q8P39_02210 [Candidatus Yanofskybacteria bacterium]|nr:hypothetical protein [Candidatus Yanofskybacteria bacterium]
MGIGMKVGKDDLWGFFMILLGTGAFSVFAAVLEHVAFGAGIWAIALLSLFVFFSALGVWMVFAPSSKKTYGVCASIGLSSLVFLFVNAWAVAGSFFFAAFLIWAFSSVKDELALLKKVKVFRVLRRGIFKAVFGLSILLAIVYGAAIAAVLQEQGELIPEPMIEGMVPAVTVEEFQHAVNATILRTFQGEIEFANNVRAEEQLSVFLHRLINERFQEILEPYRGITPLFLVFGAFLILRVLSIPFLWIALGGAWLCVRILFAAGRVGIEREQTLTEELVWNARRHTATRQFDTKQNS